MNFQLLYKLIPYINFVLTTILNILLLWLIVKKTKSNIGNYKYLMMFFALFNMGFSLVEVICKSGMNLMGADFIAFCTGVNLNRGYRGEAVSCFFIVSFFASSLAVLVVHFVYRYVAICHPRFLILFSRARFIFMWFVFILLVDLDWTLTSIFSTWPSDDSNFFIDKLAKEYGKNQSTTKDLSESSTNRPEPMQWIAYFGVINLLSILIFTFSVIIFCAIKIFFKLNSSELSKKTKELQYQLYKALIVQTLIPIIFTYLPCLLTLLSPFISRYIGSLANLGSPIFLTCYPVLDPIAIIYFIRDYREAVKILLGYKSTIYPAVSTSYSQNTSFHKSHP